MGTLGGMGSCAEAIGEKVEVARNAQARPRPTRRAACARSSRRARIEVSSETASRMAFGDRRRLAAHRGGPIRGFFLLFVGDGGDPHRHLHIEFDLTIARKLIVRGYSTLAGRWQRS